ncbi:MarR family winged helix-turn-helix transcriptional regulator [Mameliella alba]|nr:MarR family winged helix-turn-helix transcriptional regulator [Mameliella alba]MBY6170520.1 MarR family winged helix-turn-helix transcriptional regulator [Mameliella alba]MBY6175538.1 MarR family winged helix-turn-helix transcriptional regulator [Mameliella alba]
MKAIHTMPGHLIRRLQQLSSSVFAEQMRAAGVDLTSPQFAALAMLQEHPGIDQATLAGMIAHDRATMGGVVERLCAKGLIERRTNPNDRRAKVLDLTPEGKARITHIRPIVEDMQRNLLSGLDEDEQREFLRLATKLAEAGNDRTRAPLRLPKSGRDTG